MTENELSENIIMKDIRTEIGFIAGVCVNELWGITSMNTLVETTRKEFEGDYTIVVFPYLKFSKKSPEQTAIDLGEAMRKYSPYMFEKYNVVKGFLNLSLGSDFWAERLSEISDDNDFGLKPKNSSGETIMVEYSSPNTNKPLHLGHVRNNLLGYSVAKILEANGHRVIKANLVNDRGIHICKSMLAWQLYGNDETPASSGIKGDHLVGKYYVEFDKHYKQQVTELVSEGQSEDDAKRNAPLMLAAQEMLRKWEAHDEEVYSLWEMMNGWVYEGFNETYKMMGVSFDKMYYESQTYLLGKEIVEQGLAKGVFYRREDGSVWVDLTSDGLDEKLLLRSDGTSVYMTQDLGTAYRRFEDEHLDQMIYVVGNEQNYHFQVLKLVLGKLGYDWSERIYHLSYGMVELPHGKMKSREGTVVDADDLMQGMIEEAYTMSQELGKLDGVTPQEAADISRMVGLGALKYFILKVDPTKTMLFNPAESIDFNGNTGPFIQYTHARICSILRKADEFKVVEAYYIRPDKPEIELIKTLADYPMVVSSAGVMRSPALIANYIYELAKSFNGYYHDHSILKETDEAVRMMRIELSRQVAKVIRSGAGLLGIEMPERM